MRKLFEDLVEVPYRHVNTLQWQLQWLGSLHEFTRFVSSILICVTSFGKVLLLASWIIINLAMMMIPSSCVWCAISRKKNYRLCCKQFLTQLTRLTSYIKTVAHIILPLINLILNLFFLLTIWLLLPGHLSYGRQ